MTFEDHTVSMSPQGPADQVDRRPQVLLISASWSLGWKLIHKTIVVGRDPVHPTPPAQEGVSDLSGEDTPEKKVIYVFLHLIAQRAGGRPRQPSPP